MSTPGGGILPVTYKDKATLYQAYMPFVRNGGLFVPTTRRFKIGDSVLVALMLLDDPNKLPVAGKIIWTYYSQAQAGKVPGVGVQFSDADKGQTRNKIETLLAGMLATGKPTYTM